MEGKIYGAMADIMAEVGAIAKDEKNKMQGFNYRGIDTVYNTMHGVFINHRVFATVSKAELVHAEALEKQTKDGTKYALVRIFNFTWRFTHGDDGSYVETTIPGEGVDPGDKASTKAVSYSAKYALLTTFLVPTEDMEDGDRAGGAETALKEVSGADEAMKYPPWVGDYRADKASYTRKNGKIREMWYQFPREGHDHYRDRMAKVGSWKELEELGAYVLGEYKKFMAKEKYNSGVPTY